MRADRDATDVADHPAKFSDTILACIETFLTAEQESLGRSIEVLDPFAGTGKIHTLRTRMIKTHGVEIEPEWAEQSMMTLVGNALDLPFGVGRFDAIATSPTYGNRMADHHEAKDDSKRMTYRHQLGRQLDPDNSGQLGWGEKYREFHEQAWREATRVLRPGGLFVLNLKNFYRTRTIKGTRVNEVVDVCQWHLDALTDMGYQVEADMVVPVRGMRMGTNYTKRVAHEMVYALRRQG